MMTAHEALAAIWDHVRYRIDNTHDPAFRDAFIDVSNGLFQLRKRLQPSMDEIIEEIELRGGW